MAGRLKLGASVAQSVARIAADRVGEAFGRGLPRTREQLARPEVIDTLLRKSAPPGSGPWPPVESVRLAGVDFESSNCSNFLIDVTWGPRAAGADDERELPSTLYAKLPCAELATRAFAGAVGFWESEVAFCQRIAHRLKVRVPRVYAAAQQGSRFVLLLENLHETPGTTLFLNRDMAAGTTIERAKMCLRTFAELHAAFWNIAADEREALFPRRLHTYLAPGGREKTRALNASAIDPAHAAAPDVFTREHVAIAREAIGKWDALTDFWYREPLTLIHGDSHLANCFEVSTPGGARMGLLDFQGVQWCQGIRDVQYFLSDSLDSDLLARHEDELIDEYLAALADHAVSLDADRAREHYRAYSFQTLMVALVSIGLGTLTEREATVRRVLARSVASLDRLAFGKWIRSL